MRQVWYAVKWRSSYVKHAVIHHCKQEMYKLLKDSSGTELDQLVLECAVTAGEILQ